LRWQWRAVKLDRPEAGNADKQGKPMTPLAKRRLLGAVWTIGIIAAASVPAPAQDKEAVLKERQATMKQQGRDLGRIKGYLDGTADQPAAVAAAADLTRTTGKIPDLFPPGTAGPSPDGDYQPKPRVWSERGKFLDAQKTAAAKAEALLAAVKGGDKTAIRTAFVDLGKNGCGSCHTGFREKLKP
jgi:cytochrome c556